MKPIWIVLAFVISMVLSPGLASLGVAGEGYSKEIRQFEGQITSIRIEECGLEPGLCKGLMVLAEKGGGERSMSIRVGTWIKRGDRLLTIEDLRVGRPVTVMTFRMAGEEFPRVALLEFVMS